MKRLCYGIVGLLCAITNAAAQSTDQLEQQLQELKQQYAESTRTMEQRISALEKQIEAQQIAKNQATPAEHRERFRWPTSPRSTLGMNGFRLAQGLRFSSPNIFHLRSKEALIILTALPAV
jgi:hypothetical protein